MANEPTFTQDAFRFVSVRSPKPTSLRSLKSAFINYDVQNPSPLFKKLATIISQTGISKAEKRALLQKTAFEVQNSQQVFTNVERLHEKFMPQLLVAEQLQSRRKVEFAYLQGAVAEAGAKPLNADQKNLLWDTVIVQIINTTNPDLRQQAIKALKADHVVANMGTEKEPLKDERVLQELNSATLVLPAPVFPLPMPEAAAIKTEKPQQTAADLQRIALTEYNLCQSSIKELKTLYKTRHTLAMAAQGTDATNTVQKVEGATETPYSHATRLNEPEPELVARNIERGGTGKDEKMNGIAPDNYDVLSADVIQTLSESTQGALKRYPVPENSTIHTATEVLEGVAKEKFETAVADVKAEQPLVQVGGTYLLKRGGRLSIDPSVTPRDSHDVLMPDEVIDPKLTQKLKLLSVGDLKIVRQTLQKYTVGEIAHVENVLKGESKNRKTRRLSRLEEMYSYESEMSKEEERDTQSTDRHELSKESSKVISKDSDISAGVNASASWGPVSVGAYANYSTSTSSTQSDSEAETYAKEVTQRAVERITNRVKEQRSTNKIEEYKEVNAHGIDNKNGTDHTVGVYRWLNKFYKAQLMNYGKRLMLNLTVPEPAAFYIYSQEANADKVVNGVKKPLNPADAADMQSIGLCMPLLSADQIDRSNYQAIASKFGLIAPEPPVAEKVIGKKAFRMPDSSDDMGSGLPTTAYYKYRALADDKIIIPAGYQAMYAKYSFNGHAYSLNIQLGEKYKTHIMAPMQMIFSPSGLSNIVIPDVRPSFTTAATSNNVNVMLLDGQMESLSFALSLIGIGTFTLDITVRITPETEFAWKQEVFELIMDNYQSKLQEYESALEDTAYNVQIKGKNPERNREIERMELQKSCIHILREGQSVPTTTAMTTESVSGVIAYPSFNVATALQEGKVIDFFQSAFEWNLMTYLFSPYFYGRKPNWVEVLTMEDTDAIFQNFLQAGSAKIVLPVRPGHEKSVLYYLETGTVWEGDVDAVPVSGVSRVRDIASEFADRVQDTSTASEPTEGVAEGTAWDVVVPTNLVILQNGTLTGANSTIAIE